MMDDITSRREQIDIVLSGAYAEYDDNDLSEYEDELFQFRSWQDVEYISAEWEFREAYYRTRCTRDEWARKEIAKIERVF